MKVQGYLLLLLCWGISVSLAPGLFAQSVNAQSETAVEATARLRKEQGLTTEQPAFEQAPIQAGELLEISVSGDPVRKAKPAESGVSLTTTEVSNTNSEALVAYRAGKPISGTELLKLSAQDQQAIVDDLKSFKVEPSTITAEAMQQLPATTRIFIQKHPAIYILQ